MCKVLDQIEWFHREGTKKSHFDAALSQKLFVNLTIIAHTFEGKKR